MQGAKPIEPGCKALVINIPTEYGGGTVVGVERPFHEKWKTQEKNLWLLDRMFRWWHQQNFTEHNKYDIFGWADKTYSKTVNEMYPVLPERCLMRIDDDEFNKQFEEEQHNENKRTDRIGRPAKEPVSVPDGREGS